MKTNSQGYSWRTVTADLTQLMRSSKQGSVSLGEMPEAQQANVFHPQIPGKHCANTLRGKVVFTWPMWLTTVKMSHISPRCNCIAPSGVTPETNWLTNLMSFHKGMVNGAVSRKRWGKSSHSWNWSDAFCYQVCALDTSGLNQLLYPFTSHHCNPTDISKLIPRKVSVRPMTDVADHPRLAISEPLIYFT